MRTLATILILASTLALVPTPVGASHCDDETYVFSRFQAPTGHGTAAAAYNGIMCGTVGVDDENADARIINPGANAVKARYLQTSAVCEDATATFNGLGLTNIVVDLNLIPGTTGTFCDTVWISIDPAAVGTLTVDVSVEGGAFTETVVYRR